MIKSKKAPQSAKSSFCKTVLRHSILVFICLAVYRTGFCQKNAVSAGSSAAVIFDTDMGPDYDDVGAISLLHALADSGKIHILATMASNKYEGIAAVLNVFNTYFRRPDIPIGVPVGEAVNERDSQHWTDTILAKYPHAIRRNSEASDAVGLYRRILAGQPDHSVIIITVGFLTNLSGLLHSGPDGYSSLAGSELVKQKVRRLVSMAGKFLSGREFNVFRDAVASRYVFSNWPGVVWFSGFEIGQQIKCGLPLVNNALIQNSPVKDVFRISLPLAQEDHLGRMSWDETAVLVSTTANGGYFDLKKGHILVNADGQNTWDGGGEGQFYLVVKRPLLEVQQVIDLLIMHQPGN